LAKVDLCFPNNVSDYDLQMSIQSVNFQEFSFLSKEAKELNSKSNSQNVDGLDALGKFALNAATNTFKIESKQLSARKFKETADLNDKLKIRKSSLAAEMVMLHLNCDNPSLKVGSKISFSTKPLQDKAAQNHGEFIITSITHSTDGIGNYENLVYAIPSSVTIPPNPFIEKPMAETQMGIVLDNNDPEKRGRVQVKLLWQENDEKTPWLRVMSLSAGAQNGDKKNRGIFFTPEVGDMVLVGFTQNDPERPFVLGSMPTGKTSDTTKNNDNQTKAIRTRTGATIYFHDKEKSKEQEIRIQTDKENYLSILVNNGNGNIKLYSTKEIEVKSKELINIKSGGTINISATKELNMKAENIKMEASDSITIKAEKNIKQKSGQDFEVEAGKDLKSKATMNVSLEGGSKTHVAGMVVDVQSQTTMEVKAQAMLSVQASGITEVKGGLVKIN
jgi:uncharacterized protein involved in type VI secretion and phage assembly